jgi:hypothetical protein
MEGLLELKDHGGLERHKICGVNEGCNRLTSQWYGFIIPYNLLFRFGISFHPPLGRNILPFIWCLQVCCCFQLLHIGLERLVARIIFNKLV